jgi:thiol-disulfide isomerase/thioredoxin
MRSPKAGRSGRYSASVRRIGGLVLLLCAILLRPDIPAASDRPILRGYSSQFIYLRPLREVGPTQFLDGVGQPVDFTRFQGKIVLANLWATWCAPCAYEIPALNRLQAEMGAIGSRSWP